MWRLCQQRNTLLGLLAVISVVVGCAVAASVGASPSSAANSTATSTSGASPVDSGSTAPEWLEDRAAQAISDVCGTAVDPSTATTSVSWAETTSGKYEEAIGGSGDASATNDVYVVVAQGSFKSTMFGSGGTDDAASGTVLVLTFDGPTKALNTVDLLYSADGLDSAALGALSPLTLAVE